VVTTNDFHGWIIPTERDGHLMGGAHWLEGYLNVIREENPGRVLHLDAGDIWQGALISDYFSLEPAIEILNMMDLAAVGLGNHEIAIGIEKLQEVGSQIDYPLLAGNVFYRPGHRPRGQGWRVWPLEPFVISKVKGVKVGLIGVIDPSVVAYFGPGSWVNQELYFADPLMTVRNSLRQTERSGAILNIVLTHIQSTPDYQAEYLEYLACNPDPNRVHLIVTGHMHTAIAQEVCGIPVVQSWDWGTAFSRVDFNIDKSTHKVVGYRMNIAPTRIINPEDENPVTYQRWDTEESVEVIPDPLIQERVEYWRQRYDDALNDIIGYITDPLTFDFWDEHSMGDWISDRMREAFEYQVDFAVSRNTYAELDEGDITLEEAYIIRNNELIIVELTGNEVIQVLEEGITGTWAILQVSGLQFTIDLNQPVGSRIIGSVIDTNTGLPIDSDTTYHMITTDYLANGSQGMYTLVANPQQNTEIFIRDYLIQWIRNNSPFTPPDPTVEQRITVLNKP
jgi:2',3'-cyclic-nucleotide 2'-phosphodiesterase (5'-nucleotidase family)